jgi:hypothetical protein
MKILTLSNPIVVPTANSPALIYVNAILSSMDKNGCTYNNTVKTDGVDTSVYTLIV